MPDMSAAVKPDEFIRAAVGNFERGRNGAKVDRVVIHVADGTYSGTLNWFTDSRAKVSAHYTIGSGGRIGQSVGLSDTAYHAGDLMMNYRSVGIEHEGGPSKGLWIPTILQLHASAIVTSHLCFAFDIPIDRQHIIGHNEVNPDRADRKNCPGPTWPWEQYMGLVRQAYNLNFVEPTAPLPEKPVRLFDPSTNEQIGTGTLVGDKVYIKPKL